MLVLASQSPRRQELLLQAGIPFTVRVAGVEEQRAEGEAPDAYVRRLACAKALAVDRAPDEMVLGADTIVVLDDDVLEKPRDEEDAARMLRLLSGRWHQVLTGICLAYQEETHVAVETTRVLMASLSEWDIQDYITTGEPLDKAGAYGIQGLAAIFIPAIEGCYFNVVGLPLARLTTLLREFRQENS